jgi:hypothetical protein
MSAMQRIMRERFLHISMQMVVRSVLAMQTLTNTFVILYNLNQKGRKVIVEKQDGTKYQGVFHTAVFDHQKKRSSYDLILKMARKLVQLGLLMHWCFVYFFCLCFYVDDFCFVLFCFVFSGDDQKKDKKENIIRDLSVVNVLKLQFSELSQVV